MNRLGWCVILATTAATTAACSGPTSPDTLDVRVLGKAPKEAIPMPRFMLDESQVNPDPFATGGDVSVPPPPSGGGLIEGGTTDGSGGGDVYGGPANPPVPGGTEGDVPLPPPPPEPPITPPENMPPNVPEVGQGGELPELPAVVPAVPPGASLPMKKGTFALPGSRGARAALGGRTFGPAFTPSPLRTGPGVPLVGGSGGSGGGSITEAAAAAGMSPQELIDQILRKLQSGA